MNLTVHSNNHDVIPRTFCTPTATDQSFTNRGLNGNPGTGIHATPTSRRNFIKATEFEVKVRPFLLLKCLRNFLTLLNSILAFKEMCATNFAQIKATQSNISGMLVTALETLGRLESDRPAKKAVQVKDFGVKFPMRTSEDVEQVESLLDSNESFRNYMVQAVDMDYSFIQFFIVVF